MFVVPSCFTVLFRVFICLIMVSCFILCLLFSFVSFFVPHVFYSFVFFLFFVFVFVLFVCFMLVVFVCVFVLCSFCFVLCCWVFRSSRMCFSFVFVY